MKKSNLFIPFVILFISALSYLPLIRQIGYINDDWYLMYSAGAYGPGSFIDIFSVDRPARALVMMPAYALFGGNPLYYNLSAYVFRLASALAFFWTLRMLFPRQRSVGFLASLLFLIYPGFLSQPNGIDYQSHLIALAAAHLSIALTIKAVLTERFASKAALHVLSVIFGLLYLSQMEWYIGFELFRWGSVFLLFARTRGQFARKVWQTLRVAFPSIIIPGIFLVWRFFFFQSERGATDVDLQFEQVRLYPLQTLYHWGVQVIRDLFDVTISAWVTPLSQLTGYIQYWGGLLAVLVVGVLIYALRLQAIHNEQDELSNDISREALLLGLFVAIGGLIPIAMVNRDVSFPFFSRYSLVSSAGVALFLAVLVFQLRSRAAQYGFAVILVVVSFFTHHANTVKASQQTALTQEFWWQVSWRVPQLERNTTLIATYPGIALEEDYFIWGPANLIYYPDKQNPEEIQPGVFAAILNRDTVNKVLARERQEYDNRKNIITYANYRNILVLTKPSANSCVHILNGTQPEFSRAESDSIRMIAPYSEIEHVLADETPHTPPTLVFGPEPDHGWCFFYQKADLARQRGDWGEVKRIGEQAFELGFKPNDAIEWMPFLQAYTMEGNTDRLAELAPVITADPYLSRQACQTLGAMPGISGQLQDVVNTLYCVE